jgi:NACHT domain
MLLKAPGVKMQGTFSPHLRAAGTHITHVYDDADGELLILGEPGAGKTILLLELACDLIERATLDEGHPIPVIFDLSSWAETRQPLIDWMGQELNTKYQIPRKLATTWIANDQILPLLDGLDEMVEVHRAACVETINGYRGEHGLVPMVVCSRYSAYIVLPVRIILSNAVVIQPLTASQIDTYVSSVGENLAAMRIALQSDALLQEMASTPFMLSILAHSYQGLPIEEVLMGDSLSERRRIIFEQYVKRVLSRHGPNKDYTLEQIQHKLKWLARQLIQRSQTEFFVERIQPDWPIKER